MTTARSAASFLRTGEQIAADFVVLAVPFDRVSGLIPEQHPPSAAGSRPSRVAARGPDHRGPSLVRPAGLPVRPRGHSGPADPVGLQPHGHSEDEGLRKEHRGPGRTAGAAAVRDGQYLQLVISASYDLLALDKVAIRDAVMADLAAIWPAAASGSTVEVVGRHRARGHVCRSARCRQASAPSTHARSTASSWRATGRIPAGPPRWRGPFGADIWPPREFSACWIGRPA